MTNEEFLRDVCPNHTDKSQWNKSELLSILGYHKEQLRLHNVSDLLIAWEQFKKDNWWESDAVDVEKVLIDKFQAIYGR